MNLQNLRLGLENSIKNDAGVKSALGQNVRIYEAPIKGVAMPFAAWRRFEVKPLNYESNNGFEITATLEIVCKNNGISEAKQAVFALSSWAQNAKPTAEGIKISLILVTYGDAYTAIDGRSFLGVVRLKIIAEDL